MTSDQLKASAEKYDEKMRKTDPEMNGLSMREEAFIAGAELMRADITELERKLAICVGALEFYGNRMSYSMDYDTSNHGLSRRVILYSDQEEFNDVTSVAGRRAREALASIQAESSRIAKGEV